MTAETVRNPFAAAGSTPEREPAVIRAVMTEITPALAREWIRLHEAAVSAERTANSGKARDNRRLRVTVVERYARDMKAGNWHRNGEAVKIAWNDKITDGQHRLYACLRADVPFWSVAVTGVDPETQDTVDTGLPRRLSDQLAIAEEKNPVLLGQVVRWSLRWLHGARAGGGAAAYQPTQVEQLDYLKADPRLRLAAAYAARAKTVFKPVRPPVYAMAWMVLHGADWAAAEVFLERVLDGADLPRDHPVLALRDRMMNAKLNDERLTEHEQLALFVLAWNAFREDRTLAKVALPKGGLSPKNFPEPK